MTQEPERDEWYEKWYPKHVPWYSPLNLLGFIFAVFWIFVMGFPMWILILQRFDQ